MTRASSLPAEHIGGPVRSSHPEQGRSAEQLVRQAQPVVLSLFRIVVGLLFACHGLKSLFGLFQGIDGHGSTLSPVNWPGGCAADIQLLAGMSVMLGLLTRPAALIASGSMAYAYFEVHLPTGFWPIADHGEPAVMFCWAFFLLVFTGPGSLTVGSLVHRLTDVSRHGDHPVGARSTSGPLLGCPSKSARPDLLGGGRVHAGRFDGRGMGRLSAARDAAGTDAAGTAHRRGDRRPHVTNARRNTAVGTQSEPGIFMSCSHDGCACRVEVHEPCHCSGQGEYRCHCGAPMVPAGG